jgi:branched-subunit amino acid transport protein
MNWQTIALVGGMALVTFACRYPVLALMSRVTLPPQATTTLRFIPTAVLTAILAPAILAPAGEVVVRYDNPALVAALVCGWVAWRTKNVLFTILSGMVVWWGWRWALQILASSS